MAQNKYVVGAGSQHWLCAELNVNETCLMNILFIDVISQWKLELSNILFCYISNVFLLSYVDN